MSLELIGIAAGYLTSYKTAAVNTDESIEHLEPDHNTWSPYALSPTTPSHDSRSSSEGRVRAMIGSLSEYGDQTGVFGRSSSGSFFSRMHQVVDDRLNTHLPRTARLQQRGDNPERKAFRADRTAHNFNAFGLETFRPESELPSRE